MFLFMLLKHGVSRMNVVSLFLIAFMVNFVIYLRSSMISYLLFADYNYSKQDSGAMAAKLGLYADLGVIPCEFVLGTLFDLFGRKKFICGGMIIVGVTLIVITFFSEVYPWLLVFMVILYITLLPTVISPLQVDYLLPESMGASNAWFAIVGLIGNTTATSGSLKIMERWSINVVFISYGTLTILVALFLTFTLKEVFKPKATVNSDKLMTALK